MSCERWKSHGSIFPFCCLLRPKNFSTTSTILFGFSFSVISLLLKEFLKLINDSLKCFINMSFFLLFSHKSFTKNDGALYVKYSLNICSLIFFSSFLISFKNSLFSFNEDVLCLVCLVQVFLFQLLFFYLQESLNRSHLYIW